MSILLSGDKKKSVIKIVQLALLFWSRRVSAFHVKLLTNNNVVLVDLTPSRRYIVDVDCVLWRWHHSKVSYVLRNVENIVLPHSATTSKQNQCKMFCCAVDVGIVTTYAFSNKNNNNLFLYLSSSLTPPLVPP